MQACRHVGAGLLAMAGLALSAQPAIAGMPAPYTLNDLARLRIETISFFLVVLLASAALVRWIWNGLRRGGASRLPHLSYGKALGVVVLWGLLFSVVLAMISGARELMTPGAWDRQGATYKLIPREQAK